MAHLLLIIGVTGQQGSSVANTILSDPELSQQYKIRGITRDPSKPEAQALQGKGIEVVKGDLANRESMKAALKDVHSVFAFTTSSYTPGGFDTERAQGLALADDAVAAGVQFYIWSTVPSPNKLTNGRLPLGSWDLKAEIEEYIRTLPMKAAFFAPGYFMSNVRTIEGLRPQEDGTLAWTGYTGRDMKLPMIDTAADTGKYVGAMLADPEKWNGKTMYAATRFYSVDEREQILSKATGKTVKYNQIPKDVFASFLPEGIPRNSFLNMYDYLEQVGYYGADGEALVSSSAAQARGKLTTFEEHLANDPLSV